MPRRTLASVLLLTVVLALPLPAAPLELPSASWLEAMVTAITETIEAAFQLDEASPPAASSSAGQPELTDRSTPDEVDTEEEEPLPDFWPGYDPIG